MESFKLNRQTKEIKLGGIKYKPYALGNLPPSFAFDTVGVGEDIKHGIKEWFNYKGLTYIEASNGL
jgi:hypothetical protein